MTLSEISEKILDGYIFKDKKHPEKIYRFNKSKDIVESKKHNAIKWDAVNTFSRFFILSSDIDTWEAGEHQDEHENASGGTKNAEWLQEQLNGGKLVLHKGLGRVFFRTQNELTLSVHQNIIKKNGTIDVFDFEDIQLHLPEILTDAFASASEVFVIKDKKGGKEKEKKTVGPK